MLARLPFIQRAERMSGSGKVWAALPDGRSLVKEHSGADASREIEPAEAARGTARFGGGGCLQGQLAKSLLADVSGRISKRAGGFPLFRPQHCRLPCNPDGLALVQ